MLSNLLNLIFSLFIFSSFYLNANETKHVIAIGAPTIDFLLDVDESFLDSIKGKKGGCEVVDWPTFKSIVHENRSFLRRYATGGSSANTIKGIASLGLEASFFGRIGNDDLGEFFFNRLLEIGVTPELIRTEKPTQQVACLITPDYQRTMRCFLGATLEFSDHDIIPEIFEGKHLVHIEGYALRHEGLVKKAFSLAKEKGLKTSFDLGAHELALEYKDSLMKEILPIVDVLFANQDEAFALTGLDPKEACHELQKIVDTVVILIGKDGCYVGSKGTTSHFGTTPADMVDSTGAGDLFASGFIYGYLKGLSHQESAQIGNLLGGAVVEEVGAEISDDRWEMLLNKIRSLDPLPVLAGK